MGRTKKISRMGKAFLFRVGIMGSQNVTRIVFAVVRVFSFWSKYLLYSTRLILPLATISAKLPARLFLGEVSTTKIAFFRIKSSMSMRIPTRMPTPIPTPWRLPIVLFGCLLVAMTAGCTHFFRSFDNRSPSPYGTPDATALIQNPLFVPAMDKEFLWNQVVDALDADFRIRTEQRFRVVGGIPTAGRIETYPAIGSTLFEPWRGDSTSGYERLHATLQSVRRRAVATITPSGTGYLIRVEIFKELEDLNRPENATIASDTLRHDGSVARPRDGVKKGPVTLGWISQGRDQALEQKILTDIRSRLLGDEPPSRLPQPPTPTPPLHPNLAPGPAPAPRTPPTSSLRSAPDRLTPLPWAPPSPPRR